MAREHTCCGTSRVRGKGSWAPSTSRARTCWSRRRRATTNCGATRAMTCIRHDGAANPVIPGPAPACCAYHRRRVRNRTTALDRQNQRAGGPHSGDSLACSYTDLYDSGDEEGARRIKGHACMQLARQWPLDLHLQPEILSHNMCHSWQTCAPLLLRCDGPCLSEKAQTLADNRASAHQTGTSGGSRSHLAQNSSVNGASCASEPSSCTSTHTPSVCDRVFPGWCSCRNILARAPGQ
jgi:hypothetical protein